MSDDEIDYDAVLKGDRRSLAKAISIVEDRGIYGAPPSKIGEMIGKAFVIGITGPLGTGKSTLVDRLIDAYVGKGRTVGVLAIDPTSPITGGALLGDRLRMTKHSLNKDVFIRSMASRGEQGGLAKSTKGVVSLLRASGKNIIIVETIGAGQSDVEVMNLTDVVVVVTMPGLGDEIQTSKAGLMEVGDIFVINKSDLGGADKMMIYFTELLRGKDDPGRWAPRVVKLSSVTGEGISDLVTALNSREEFVNEKKASPFQRKRENIEDEIINLVAIELKTIVMKKLSQSRDLRKFIDLVEQGQLDSLQAAQEISSKLIPES